MGDEFVIGTSAELMVPQTPNDGSEGERFFSSPVSLISDGVGHFFCFPNRWMKIVYGELFSFMANICIRFTFRGHSNSVEDQKIST